MLDNDENKSFLPDESNKNKLTPVNLKTSITNDHDEDTGKGLAKSLTLMNGVSIIVGCIIGSGIFLTPSNVHEKAGSVGMSLLIWTFCGVFVGIGSYCYAELGTLIKKSGGDYAYIMEAFGPFVAFIRLWIEAIIVRPCTITVVALTFSLYILRPLFGNCEPTSGTHEIIAAALITLLTAINCISVKLSTKVQDIFTFAKMFALLLIIATGIYFIIKGDSVNRQSFQNIFEGTNTNMGEISLAFYSGLFTYQGWNYLNFIVEELQNPKRNLPLAILISCVTVTVIYVLTNVAIYSVLSPAEMLKTDAVAVEFGRKVFGNAGVIMMPLFVACSTLGSANGVIFTSSRLFYVGAREGQMPELLTMINKETRTPIPAVSLTGFLALLYLFVSNNANQLIIYMQVSYWLAIGTTVVTLFVLRLKMPNAPRPIKVMLIFPIIFVLACIALVLIPIIGQPQDTMIGIALLFSAVPVYLLFIGWKSKPKFLNNLTGIITVFFQKLFLVVNDEEKKN